MNIQEVKIVNTKTGGEVFFFKHSFKSAFEHAQNYHARNYGDFPMEVYRQSNKPAPFPRWEPIKFILNSK